MSVKDHCQKRARLNSNWFFFLQEETLIEMLIGFANIVSDAVNRQAASVMILNRDTKQIVICL